MSSFIVPCPHCAGTAQVNAATLPDRPAFFACPHCAKKVPVDKRQLLGQTPSGQAPRQSSPQAGQAGQVPPSKKHTIPDLPDGVVFSPGIVVGVDEAAIGQLQQTLSGVGGELQRVDSVDAARERIVHEQTQLCVYVAGSAGAAPHAPLASLTTLAPNVRRSLYLVLVADDVQTLDGMTAFLHEVNLVVNKADLPKFAAALHCGQDFHNRLYDPYFLAEAVC